MRFLFILIMGLLPFATFSQSIEASLEQGFKDLRVRLGLYGQYNFVDSKAYNFGLNVIATHGQLSNNRYVFYGVHIGLNKFNADSLRVLGAEVGLSTKFYNSFPLGLEIDVTSIYLKDDILLLPTIGIGYFGFLSINYGYYFSLTDMRKYNLARHHLALKMTLNFSSSEFLNLKGVSPHKW